MFSMVEPTETRRRMYPREDDDWSDYQQYYGPGHGVSLSVLPNRKIGPALNESPSRPRGKVYVIVLHCNTFVSLNVTYLLTTK